MQARSDAPAHPATAPPQAQPAGVWTAEQPNSRTAIRAVASLGPVCAARGACAREVGPSAAQRSNGPCGCWLPKPLCMRRGAQRAGWHVGRRTHMHRGLTRRSCLSGARQRAASSATHPAREHRRLPVAKRRDADSGVAFSLVTFFLATQKKVTRMPGDSRPPPSTKARGQISAWLRKAQPERIGVRPGFDKPTPNKRRHPHQLLRAQPERRTNPVSSRPSTNPEAQNVFSLGTSRDTCALPRHTPARRPPAPCLPAARKPARSAPCAAPAPEGFWLHAAYA